MALGPSRVVVGLDRGQLDPKRLVPAPYRQEPSPSSLVPARNSQAKTQISKRQACEWWGRVRASRVQGYSVADGMIYVGESLPDLSGRDNDACLIDPRFKCRLLNLGMSGDEVGDRPRYADMPPRCRGISGSGWRPVVVILRPILDLCVFVFYGLERRLFVDGQNGLLSLARVLK